MCFVSPPQLSENLTATSRPFRLKIAPPTNTAALIVEGLRYPLCRVTCAW
jgi:hypothetical protein